MKTSDYEKEVANILPALNENEFVEWAKTHKLARQNCTDEELRAEYREERLIGVIKELWIKLATYETDDGVRKLRKIALAYANMSVRLTKALRILDELKLLLTDD